MVGDLEVKYQQSMQNCQSDIVRQDKQLEDLKYKRNVRYDASRLTQEHPELQPLIEKLKRSYEEYEDQNLMLSEKNTELEKLKNSLTHMVGKKAFCERTS